MIVSVRVSGGAASARVGLCVSDLCVRGCVYGGHMNAAGGQRGDPAVVEAQPQRLGTGVGEGDVERAGEGEHQLPE